MKSLLPAALALAAAAALPPAHAATDTAAPVLNSISIQGRPDMRLSNPFVDVTLDASDDTSGVVYMVVWLASPSGHETIESEFGPADHPLHSVRQQRIGVGRAGQGRGFTRYSEPGTWRVTGVQLQDRAGNVSAYSGAELDALGTTTFELINGQYDATPPTLIKGRILTPTVSLSGDWPYAETSVTVKDTGVNAPSGIDYIVLYYCLPPVVNFECSDYLQTVGSFGVPAKSASTLVTGGPLFSTRPASGTRPGASSHAGPGRSNPPKPGTYELTHVEIIARDGNNAGYYSPLVGGGNDLHHWFPSLTLTVTP